MPSTTVSFLDLIPDEILAFIISFTVISTRAFLIERCFYPLPKDDDKPEKRLSRFPMDIYYRHSDVLTYYRTNLPSAQPEHIADWLFINSTNKRIRRLGKEIFFRVKPFAMSSKFTDQLRSGTCDLMSAADQTLALECIQDLTFVDKPGSPSALMKLPARVKAFPRLQRCLLVYYFFPGSNIELLWEAKVVVENEHTMSSERTGRGVLPKLKDLLVRTGFPKEIGLDVAICRGGRGAFVLENLEYAAFPVLEVKASFLDRKQKALAEE